MTYDDDEVEEDDSLHLLYVPYSVEVVDYTFVVAIGAVAVAAADVDVIWYLHFDPSYSYYFHDLFSFGAIGKLFLQDLIFSEVRNMSSRRPVKEAVVAAVGVAAVAVAAVDEVVYYHHHHHNSHDYQ